MDLLQTFSLALLQGVTEFLPISSSAHLILLPRLVGWPDQGLAFDVAVHLGTLAAVVLYFWSEVTAMALEWTRSLATGRSTLNSRLAWAVILATVPAGLAGLVWKDNIETLLREPLVIAATTIGFGALLWWADVRGSRLRTESHLRWRDALVIGLAQALALIPGTSRSGITITAGLALGLTRPAAARFSFLLSIPVIVLAGGLETLELVRTEEAPEWRALLLGALVSGLSAYLTIRFFLRLVERIGLFPFVLYRLVLGALLLALFL
jgi:undecaprenyl-diphosphatase